MADHFYSLNKGDGISPANVTTGAASTAADHVEIRVLDGAGITKAEFVQLVEALTSYIITHDELA